MMITKTPRFYVKAKDKNGKWVKGFYNELLPYTPCVAEDIDMEQMEYYISRPSFSDWGMPRTLELVPIDKGTLSGYTGLDFPRTYETDKKPEKSPLYENDIVRIGEGTEEVYGLVKWDQDICAYVIVNKNNENISIVSDIYPIFVAGNKFDNSDLLEKI